MDIFKNEYAQYGYPIFQALMRGASPGTARIAQGLDAGISTVDYMNRRNRQTDEIDLRKKRMSELLNSTKTEQAPGIPSDFNIEEGPSNENFVEQKPIGLAPPQDLPQVNKQVPVFSDNEKRLSEMLGPDKSADMIRDKVAPNQPRMHPLQEQLMRARIDKLGQPQQPAPMHPLQEENLRSQIDKRNQPPAAPQMHPLQEQNIRSQIADRARGPQPPQMHPLQQKNLQQQMQQRGLVMQKTQEAINTARSAAKGGASLGQLASYGNFLSNALKSDETPEEDKPALQAALREVVSASSRLQQQGGGQQQADPNDPLGIRQMKEY